MDGSYLERLWTDFQTTLYCHYAELALGIRIAGVIYNVLVKARLQQGHGETEEEFAQRKAELEAKSKTGKPSAAKRRLPESDEDFQARLLERYEDPQMFHRELLYIGREQIDTLRIELWELTSRSSRRAGAACSTRTPRSVSSMAAPAPTSPSAARGAVPT